MTEHNCLLWARSRPETVERVLRVVRHRGFRLSALHVQAQSDNLLLRLTVASVRPVELLLSQLARLTDVWHVERSLVADQRLSPVYEQAVSEPSFHEVAVTEMQHTIEKQTAPAQFAARQTGAEPVIEQQLTKKQARL